jgi:hypothetical protein
VENNVYIYIYILSWLNLFEVLVVFQLHFYSPSLPKPYYMIRGFFRNGSAMASQTSWYSPWQTEGTVETFNQDGRQCEHYLLNLQASPNATYMGFVKKQSEPGFELATSCMQVGRSSTRPWSRWIMYIFNIGVCTVYYNISAYSCIEENKHS